MKGEHLLEVGVAANYSQQIIPDYQGNPLIESLPPILTKWEVSERLAFYPKISEEQKELDSVYRFHLVQSVEQYFQPFQEHLDLEQRFSACMRQGYIGREPSNPALIADIYKRHESIINKDPYEYRLKNHGEDGHSGFVFIGSSGIGKTTTMRRILYTYPQVISHEKLTRIQITYLKIECSFDGTIGGLCDNFFQEIDRLLGTNHTHYVQKSRLSIDRMKTYMEHLANLYSIGILIIDEVQHLSVAKSGGEKKMLNFFVSLMNKIGLPVILIGTPKAIKVLSGEFRHARRLTGDGPELWDPLKNDKTWRLYLQGLWKYQWTKTYTPLTEELINLIYIESQGILDVATKLFRFTQEKVIKKGGKEIITPEIILQVKKEKFKLMEKMLNALKEDNATKLSWYDDIKPVKRKVAPLNQKPLTKEEFRKAIEEIEQQVLEKEVVRETKVDKIINKLIDLGIGKKKAKKYTQLAFEELGENETEEKLALKAISYEFSEQEKEEGKGISKKNLGTLEYDDNSLLSISTSAGDEFKEELKKKGIINVPTIE